MTPNSYRLPLIEITSIPAGSNQSETYRHLLGLALKAKAKPEAVDISTLPSTMIRLSPAAKAQLDAVAEQYGMEPRAAFAGLCAAGLAIMRKQLRQQAGLNKQAAADIRVPFEPKSDNQRRFYEQIMLGLLADKIVFAEGSTGIGKSRAMAAAALEMARAKKTPVILAAPTVAVMEHLYEELQLLNAAGVTYSILPGASEFVDDIALREYITATQTTPELDIDQTVIEWVARGAPALRPDAPLAHALGENAAWLMDDLRKLATNMPVDDFALRRPKRRDDNPDGESRKLLESLRNRAKTETDIILCTHAMLAIGQQTQWKAVPEPCVVIIDEAHQFEQAVASVNSDQVSVYSLRASLARLRRSEGLGKGTIASKALEEASKLTKHLQRFDIDGKTHCLTDASPEDQEDLRLTTTCLRSLGDKLASKSLNELRNIEHYRSALKSIITSLETPSGKGINRVDLAFSPDRRYPSLYCGPARVDMQLRNIWNTAKGGVVLASATIYIMDASGNSKCDYLRGLLSVDFSRISTPAPVIEKYLYTLPCLYVPSPRRRDALVPPRKQGQNTEDDWHKELALSIEHITSTAHGGTLALFTAYKDIQAVAKELDLLGVSKGRIVAQQPNRKFSEYERLFRTIHANGERPIMLALGTAWTGIDLKDHAASDETDTLLTDLVIARLPIGLNKSNSMTSRIERMGMHPIINECLLTFKQGIGRLIRRENVQHRRLWVLDGRLFTEGKWPGMEALAGGIRRLLKEYRHRKEF